ncbi:MAG: hypothetical protein N2662_09010 [Bacteroidales bacterium]|nr:hypothetical protein [Bacteroidales bacterium]
MKRLKVLIIILLYLLELKAQYINMYDHEQKLFNNQLEMVKGKPAFILFGTDMMFGNNDNVGRILAIQTLVKPDADKEVKFPFGIRAYSTYFVGINGCMQLYEWWPPNNSFAYGGRNYIGQAYYFNKAVIAGGFYMRINVHEAFEHLDYKISRSYVDKEPFSFKIRPFITYKFDRRLRFDLTTIIGNYLNADLFIKIINRDFIRFMPGINYESTVLDTSLSKTSITRVSYKNIFSLPEKKIFFKGTVGFFYDKGKLTDALTNAFNSPGDFFYYTIEGNIKWLLLGAWYRKDYGTGFYAGFGFDNFDTSRAYIKIKYNDGMIEPLYKGIKKIWSLAIIINLRAED